MQTALNEIIGRILEDDALFSLEELCRSCSLLPEQLLEMVDEGIIEPIDYQQTTTSWQFAGNSVVRVRTVIRLQRDLGVNLAGVEVILDLLDRVERLQTEVDALRDSLEEQVVERVSEALRQASRLPVRAVRELRPPDR